MKKQRKQYQPRTTLFPKQGLLCCAKKQAKTISVSAGDKKSALMCQDKECACKQGRDQGCQIMSLDEFIKIIEKKRDDTVAKNKPAVDQLKKFCDQLIYKLGEDRQNAMDFLKYFGLEQNTKTFVCLVNQTNFKHVSGDLVFKVMKQLQEGGKKYAIDEGIMKKAIEEAKEVFKDTVKTIRRMTGKKQEIEQYQEEIIEEFLTGLGQNVKVIISDGNQLTLAQWKAKGKTMKQIQGLNLSSRNLKQIPVQLRLMPNLKRINLSKNEITAIQHLIKCLQLEQLFLQTNKISIIQGLETLTNLKSLNLSQNQISTIKGLNTLENLTFLSFNSNQIQKIEGLDNLNKLQQLILDNCQIGKLENIDNLKNLKTFSVRKNTFLQDQDSKKLIAEMKALKIMVVDN